MDKSGAVPQPGSHDKKPLLDALPVRDRAAVERAVREGLEALEQLDRNADALALRIRLK